jgi:hypothetical protein
LLHELHEITERSQWFFALLHRLGDWVFWLRAFDLDGAAWRFGIVAIVVATSSIIPIATTMTSAATVGRGTATGSVI